MENYYKSKELIKKLCIWLKPKVNAYHDRNELTRRLASRFNANFNSTNTYI